LANWLINGFGFKRFLLTIRDAIMTHCTERTFSILALGLVTAMLATVGCTSKGPAAPSNVIAKKVFENTDPSIKAGTTSVVSIWELRGQEQVILGVRRLSVEYEAEVEYLKEDLPHKKGDRKKLNVSLEFEQSDKGWKAKDGNVY
jgi:hypothetical protein